MEQLGEVGPEKRAGVRRGLVLQLDGKLQGPLAHGTKYVGQTKACVQEKGGFVTCKKSTLESRESLRRALLRPAI